MARSSLLRANMERHCLTRSVRSLPLPRAFSISRHAHLYQVAAQNFEYKMSNILDKPLCVSITIANRIFSDYFRRHLGNLCLGILRCCPVRSVRTGILRCRTTRVERVHYRSISLARLWCVLDSSPHFSSHSKYPCPCSTEPARISSLRTCTSLRIA